ncbi:MAG: hypothetical protein J0M00_26070 [Burkholderiales bacterium]|jgi:hypothetical protein|nr:hypothetical protein [Burkholderiales bacterium]
MAYVLSWIFVLAMLVLWSLAAWGVHALALWTVAQAGDLTAGRGLFGGLDLSGPWLAWLPAQAVDAMNALLASLGPLLGSLLQAVPSLAGVLTLASWVIWGLGVTMLLGLGAGLHWLVAMWRRRGGAVPPAGAPVLVAG